MKYYLAIVAFLWLSPALAGGDDIITSATSTSESEGGRAEAISRDRAIALGFGNSLAQAAFEDCYVTTQDNYTVTSRQGTKLNRWCAANGYDQLGMHLMAARMRCSIPAVKELDYGGSTCVEENTYHPVNVEQELSDLVNNIIIRQDALTAPIRDEVENLRQTLEEVEKSHQKAPAPSRTIIQQQPFLNDAKREALAAIRGD